MKLSDVSVVVLDLDDTLYLERDYVRSGFRAVGQLTDQLGIGDVSEELWALFIAGVRHNTFDRALIARGIGPDPGLVHRMVETYRSHRPDISLLADASRLLERSSAKLTALITDGPAICQWAKIRALGLETRVDWCVVTADLGEGKSKPHPAAFEMVEKLSEKSGCECVYVGDNPEKDFEAPRELGWESIRVRRAASLHRGVDTPRWVGQEVESLDEVI